MPGSNDGSAFACMQVYVGKGFLLSHVWGGLWLLMFELPFKLKQLLTLSRRVLFLPFMLRGLFEWVGVRFHRSFSHSRFFRFCKFCTGIHLQALSLLAPSIVGVATLSFPLRWYIRCSSLLRCPYCYVPYFCWCVFLRANFLFCLCPWFPLCFRVVITPCFCISLWYHSWLPYSFSASRMLHH